jgi:hypothetical protein
MRVEGAFPLSPLPVSNTKRGDERGRVALILAFMPVSKPQSDFRSKETDKTLFVVNDARRDAIHYHTNR